MSVSVSERVRFSLLSFILWNILFCHLQTSFLAFWFLFFPVKEKWALKTCWIVEKRLKSGNQISSRMNKIYICENTIYYVFLLHLLRFFGALLEAYTGTWCHLLFYFPDSRADGSRHSTQNVIEYLICWIPGCIIYSFTTAHTFLLLLDRDRWVASDSLWNQIDYRNRFVAIFMSGSSVYFASFLILTLVSSHLYCFRFAKRMFFLTFETLKLHREHFRLVFFSFF